MEAVCWTAVGTLVEMTSCGGAGAAGAATTGVDSGIDGEDAATATGEATGLEGCACATGVGGVGRMERRPTHGGGFDAVSGVYMDRTTEVKSSSSL